MAPSIPLSQSAIAVRTPATASDPISLHLNPTTISLSSSSFLKSASLLCTRSSSNRRLISRAPVRAAAVTSEVEKQTDSLVEKSINTIRFLAIDAVEKASSGHPGMPMGCAPMGHILYDEVMKYNPKNPFWFNRDRFVLSAGHGCMLQYALLHLAGYDSVQEEDLKNFRQWRSRTPGHPENFETSGIEVTTGPLGQGIANAVGLALAEKHSPPLSSRNKLAVRALQTNLRRQRLTQLVGSSVEGVEKGGYVISDNSLHNKPDVILMGTRSELEIVASAADDLRKEGKTVMSLVSWELFEEQSYSYKESVLPKAVTARVSLEAGSTFGWLRYVGPIGKAIGIDRFGASAPAARLYKEFGLTKEAVIEAAKSLC